MVTLLLAFLGCAPDGGKPKVGAEAGPVDVRFDPPPAPEDGFQIVTPDLVVPPHADLMFCYVGTYTGPTTGVSFYEWIQDETFGHHVVFGDGAAFDHPDGSLIDCSEGASVMELPPLLTATVTAGDYSSTMDLDPGIAVKLETGQRWVIQSHYVNTSDDTLLARDVVNIGTEPVEDVNFWVGSWTFNNSVFEIGPQDTLELRFTCDWPQDAEILAIMGHMHDHGTAIQVKHLHDDSADLIYEQLQWDPAWQSDPAFTIFERGELPVSAGDPFELTCSFHNTTDTAVQFPTEMCVAAGLAGPLEAPIECDAGYPSTAGG